MTTSASVGPPRGALELLTALAEAMHEVTLPADVIEASLGLAAGRLGLELDVVVLQSFVALSARYNGSERTLLRHMPFDTHWRLEQMDSLLSLARRIGASPGVCVDAGQRELAAIRARRNPYAQSLVLACYGLYGAAVAARVGGGWREMGAAAFIGLLGAVIHFGTIRHRRVDMQKSFLAGAGGGLAALALARALPGLDVVSALFGGMTLLVPAMVITIGIHELANEALESGGVRLSYGLLRLLMLGGGMAAALRLWHLLWPLPPIGQAQTLPFSIVILAVAVGGVSLVACLGASARDVPWITAAAVLAYGMQELTRKLFGEAGSPTLSALVLGVAGWAFARLSNRSAATIVVPGLLQLAPGFLATHSVLQFLSGQAAGASVFEVLLIALQLATGLFLADLLVPTPHRAAGQ